MEIPVARIVNASPVELVVISYEIIIDELTNIIDGNSTSVEKAQSFLKELIVSLDMEQEISQSLMSLYIYINRLLMRYRIKEETSYIVEAKKLVETLNEAWREIALKENKIAVMQNTDTIYEGLTYGMNVLNETIVGRSNRGFRA